MIKYLFMCFLSITTICISFFQNKIANSAPNNKRAASANKKRAATGGSSGKQTQKKSNSSTKKSGSKSYSKSSSSSKKSGEETTGSLSKELKCLQDKITEIIDGPCAFLVDTDIKDGLGEEDLFCLYNYKDSGKTSSIFNYYLGAYYGITENSIKADTSIVNVRNSSKNALKYYQYLIDEINYETLQESKILDNVMEAVLKNADLDIDVQNTIEAKSIDSVPISIDIVSSDIEACTKATKSAMTECNAIGNLTVKSKIAESCTNYNAILIKLAGAKKAEALGYETEILKILKQRANADFYDYKDMVTMEKEKLELKKTYKEVLNENSALEYKEKREEAILKIATLTEEIENTTDEEVKAEKQKSIDTYKESICSYDKSIKKYDKTYKPDDDSAHCKDTSTSTDKDSDKDSSNDK